MLQADYLSGDPYRQFAAAALGILEPTEQQRQVYKATVLGRIYGLGVASLARNLGISKAQAQRIIDQMNARYPVLNAWLERVTTKAAHMRPDRLHPRLVADLDRAPGRGAHIPEFSDAGQRRRTDAPRHRARRAAGLRLIGCAHDSFLIEDTDRRRSSRPSRELQEIMRQASRDLLGGFELRADCKPTRHRALSRPLHRQARARGRHAALESVDDADCGGEVMDNLQIVGMEMPHDLRGGKEAQSALQDTVGKASLAVG